MKDVHRSAAYAGQSTASNCITVNSSVTTSTFGYFCHLNCMRTMKVEKNLSIQLSSEDVGIILRNENPLIFRVQPLANKGGKDFLFACLCYNGGLRTWARQDL